MLILIINCGSSSAKYQLYDTKNYRSLARGIVERIGHDNAELKHQKDGTVHTQQIDCRDHYVAIQIIVDILTDKKYGVIKSKDQVEGIGHRVVHGGEEFKNSVRITEKVIRSIHKYIELAPLHNPPSLYGIQACADILKGVPQVAVFDTSFHQTMSPTAFMYGLPYDYYKKYGIRRYGFHGTSHRFVAQEAAKRLKTPAEKLKLITCHLGNGCSMAAVVHGKSVDTSMGFTPLEGLLMGTRSGDLDPAVVLYLMERENMSLNRINDILNKESGLLGISGAGNDMRDIKKAMKGKGRMAERAALAIEIFIYRIKKYIGAYMAAMGGLDAVVFTAGISENNPQVINRIERDLKKILPGKVRFLVIPTNEELLIAKDTYEIIRRNNAKSKT